MGLMIGSTKPKKILLGDAKVKAVYKGDEKLWIGGAGDLGIAIGRVGNSVANVFNVYITEDNWSTGRQVASEITLGEEYNYSRIARYKDEDIYVIISGNNSSTGVTYVYKLNVDDYSLTLMNSIAAPAGSSVGLLIESENIIPITKRITATSPYYTYLSGYRFSDNTFIPWINLLDIYAVCYSEDKYIGREDSTYTFKIGGYNTTTNALTSPTTKTTTSINNDVYYSYRAARMFGMIVLMYSEKIFYSEDDGVTFTANTQFTTGYSGRMSAIEYFAYGNGRYVVLTTTSSTLNNMILVTEDGKTWTKSSLDLRNYKIRFDGHQFILYTSGSSFYVSEDGLNWTLKTMYTVVPGSTNDWEYVFG